MEKLYVVMPAYNEEANIEQVVSSWMEALSYTEFKEAGALVVADSGSTDRTHDILVELQKKYPNLQILSETEKQHGPKVIALYDYAIKSGATYIFQTDSDGQTNPEEFKEFWDMRGEYPVILGKRLERGDGKDRAFVEKVVCLLVKIFFGVDAPDANAPFRLMRADIVKKYLYKLPFDYNIPNIMLTTYFLYYKENVVFRSISFAPRRAGENSINIRKITKIGIDALGDFHRLKKEM